MGSTNQRRWTSDEVAKLKAKYPTANLDELSKELDRSIRSIVCKADTLDVVRIRNNNVVDGKKFCSMCKVWHPVNEFYRNRSKLDGYEYYCKKYYDIKEKKRNVVHKDKYKFSQTSTYEGINRERVVHEKRVIIEIDGVEHKECTECMQWLPLHEFRKKASGAGGKADKCIVCDTTLYHLLGRDFNEVKAYELEQREERCKLKASSSTLSDEEIIKKARSNVRAKRKQAKLAEAKAKDK